MTRKPIKFTIDPTTGRDAMLAAMAAESARMDEARKPMCSGCDAVPVPNYGERCDACGRDEVTQWISRHARAIERCDALQAKLSDRSQMTVGYFCPLCGEITASRQEAEVCRVTGDSVAVTPELIAMVPLTLDEIEAVLEKVAAFGGGPRARATEQLVAGAAQIRDMA